MPRPVGTRVKSRCQTWLAYLAVTTFGLPSIPPAAGPVFLAGGEGGLPPSLSIRPTVLAPRCRPARTSVWAILTLPMAGLSVFSRCTTWRTKWGNLLTGSPGSCTGAAGPSTNERRSSRIGAGSGAGGFSANRSARPELSQVLGGRNSLGSLKDLFQLVFVVDLADLRHEPRSGPSESEPQHRRNALGESLSPAFGLSLSPWLSQPSGVAERVANRAEPRGVEPSGVQTGTEQAFASCPRAGTRCRPWAKRGTRAFCGIFWPTRLVRRGKCNTLFQNLKQSQRARRGNRRSKRQESRRGRGRKFRRPATVLQKPSAQS